MPVVSQFATMGTMRRRLPALLTCLTLFAGVSFAQDDKIARGKYLVEEVAKCQECHTPKLATGGFMMTAGLKGTTLDFAPVAPVPGWHAKTPDITSTSALWTRWGEDGMVKFFETGKNPRGNKADPPMPAYAMSHDDALAVVAFLKSLK